MFLIIRLVRRRRLAGRDDPLDAHALARKHVGEDLLVGARRQVAEKIDHEVVSGLVCEMIPKGVRPSSHYRDSVGNSRRW